MYKACPRIACAGGVVVAVFAVVMLVVIVFVCVCVDSEGKSRMEEEGVKLDFKVAVFSSSEYVEDFLKDMLRERFSEVKFIRRILDSESVRSARGYDAVCLFVNDHADETIIQMLAEFGVKCIAVRCAGYDRVDLKACEEFGIRVVRVPAYSPRTVAEAALSLILAVARNIRSAGLKVAVGNYTLNGLVGVELTGKTFGIVGTGNIGVELIKLLRGFDGRVLAYDIYESEEAKKFGAEYCDLETLLKESDVVSLHTPLLPSTKHIINRERLRMMKQNSILINVSRGGLVDTAALIDELQTLDEGGSNLRGVGMDVYEGEDSLFFEDFTRLPASKRMKAWDAKFILLKSLPQVLITPHTAFLTEEALQNIGQSTLSNLVAFATGGELVNEVKAKT